MTYPEKTLFCGPRKPWDVSAGRGRGLNFPIILSARLHGYVDLSTQSPQKRQSQSLLDCDSWHLHQPMLQETLEPVGRERQSRPQAGHRPCLCQSIPGCLLHQEREPASAIPHGIRHCGEVGPGDATVLHHVSVIMVNNAHNDPRQCLLRAFRAKSTPLKSHSQASAGDSCLLRPHPPASYCFGSTCAGCPSPPIRPNVLVLPPRGLFSFQETQLGTHLVQAGWSSHLALLHRGPRAHLSLTSSAALMITCLRV